MIISRVTERTPPRRIERPFSDFNEWAAPVVRKSIFSPAASFRMSDLVRSPDDAQRLRGIDHLADEIATKLREQARRATSITLYYRELGVADILARDPGTTETLASIHRAESQILADELAVRAKRLPRRADLQRAHELIRARSPHARGERITGLSDLQVKHIRKHVSLAVSSAASRRTAGSALLTKLAVPAHGNTTPIHPTVLATHFAGDARPQRLSADETQLMINHLRGAVQSIARHSPFTGTELWQRLFHRIAQSLE